MDGSRPDTYVRKYRQEEVSEEETPKEEPKQEEKVIETLIGNLVGYGPDCYGCTSFRTASGRYIGDGKIYYAGVWTNGVKDKNSVPKPNANNCNDDMILLELFNFGFFCPMELLYL